MRSVGLVGSEGKRGGYSGGTGRRHPPGSSTRSSLDLRVSGKTVRLDSCRLQLQQSAFFSLAYTLHLPSPVHSTAQA